MCGIFGYISYESIDYENLRTNGYKCQHRGPDVSKELIINEKEMFIYLLFHRLSINGLNDNSGQPMQLKNKTLICNGEIYNYKELAKKYNIELNTESDCEIILHLSLMFPISQFINELDGVFSFIIYDSIEESITIGHDPLGIRQLYWSKEDDNSRICISSEMKCLYDINSKIEFYPPGSFSIYYPKKKKINTYSYYHFYYPPPTHIMNDTNEINIINNIKELLYQSVKKRLISERPIGCLLSGGLDSSIITSIICKILDPSEVKTFAIGLDGSPDIQSAQKVADHLGTNHTNIIISEEDMLNAIDRTIYQIESKDTTTIRASIPMLLLSEYIRDNTDIKVILSGEGSDEASGSYLYFHNSPNAEEFNNETIRLLKDVRMFDVLRADKTTAGAGLEIRVPFFDKAFLNYYMSLNPELKIIRNGMEKYLLRKTYEKELPEEIVWRRKDGFSDGVSSMNKPWYEIINQYAIQNKYLNEKDMYEKIFNKYYGRCKNIIPYNWMPRWTNNIGDNPSGRLIKQ